MTRGFRREGDTVTLGLDPEEAQAVGLVVAQVAGLIQAGTPHPATGGRAAPPGDLAGLPGLDDLAGLGDPGRLDERPAAPTDPALARLFPAGYGDDDPEAAAELRRLTQPSLRRGKVEGAQAVLDALPFEGGEVHLDADGAQTWLTALNDARLVLGTRLDLDDETDLVAELDEAVAVDPAGSRVLAISLYQFLSYLQETLLQAVDPEYG